MIACIHHNGVFTPLILSPMERKEKGVSGIKTKILIEYITETLAPEVATLGLESPILMLDRATIHSEKRILAAFEESGVKLGQVIKIPTQSAERLSPLDNAVFHDFKEQVRKSCPMTLDNIEQSMITAWNAVMKKQIHSHYRNCGLTHRCDPYEDCPNPSVHQH